jgi:hypothetical protein
MDNKEKNYDSHREGIRFTYHKIAMVCRTEREFSNAMLMLGFHRDTDEYKEAKRAWRRFRENQDNP